MLKNLLHGVFYSPQQKGGIQKITIRPILLKSQRFYQATEYRGTQVFHQNFPQDELEAFIQKQVPHIFQKALLCTEEADYHLMVNKKNETKTLKKPPTHKLQMISHNKEKNYFLKEGVPNPFLIALEIMTKEGKIIAKKYDKFRQLNRFLEMVNDVLPNLDKSRPLHIVDYGCGKSYLTFALYDFLTRQGFESQIIGLDLKKDVIKQCQQLADSLNYSGLTFDVGNIADYKLPFSSVDMVISLHACDTATDAALKQAVNWDAKVILCVPCCQHDLLKQIQQPVLKPLLKHGILKERFAALVTDAARAQQLEIAGYQVQVLEFIDLEHTPKNLLIRAIKSVGKKPLHMTEDYDSFTKFLNIKMK